MLSSDYHAVAPGHRFSVWHALNDTKRLVHFLLPVNGYAGWFVTCFWHGLWIHMYLHRRTCHAGQCPMRTGIEGRRGTMYEEPVLHSVVIFRGAKEWELVWALRWGCALRA